MFLIIVYCFIVRILKFLRSLIIIRLMYILFSILLKYSKIILMILVKKIINRV